MDCKKLKEIKEKNKDLEEKIRELEDKLSKDSHNSHKPPSTDGFRKKPLNNSLRKSNGNKPGGQRGHKGETLRMVDNPQEVIIHKAKECKICNNSLQDAQIY